MDRGGAETLVMNIYRKINRDLVQFDFVVHTADKADYDDEIYDLGGRIFKVPRYTVLNHFSYKRAWISLFQEHYKEWKAVHGHMYSTAAIYLKIAKEFGLKTIAHSHNTSSGYGTQALVKGIIQKPLKGDGADYLFACSKPAGEWLFGRDNLSRVVILNNAVDVHKFAYNGTTRSQVRRDLELDNKQVVGHVGRFETQKNHTFLIDIFNEVNKINSNCILLLIGRGELEYQIINKVDQYGLKDKVRFLGVRADISELLQAMDIFVMPSLFEGLPVTLLEAQAAGLPCLASDTITNEAKVTDLLLFMSLGETAKRWAEEVLYIALNTERKDTCKEISAAGFDMSSTVNWLQNFYLKFEG